MIFMVNVGVNGAGGRIGSSLVEELLNINGVNVVALNEPLGARYLAEKYSRFTDAYYVSDNEIKINGKSVAVYDRKKASEIPWGKYDVKIVEECSGFYTEGTEGKDARAHLSDGVERVIVSAPAKGDGLVTLVMGVNHGLYKPLQHSYISNASCTTKALAGPLKILVDKVIKVDTLLMDTVHASTTSQEVMETLNNIVLAETGAARATGLVIPDLAERMGGFAARVPTTDGSFANIYLVGVYDGELDKKKINEIFRNELTREDYRGRVGYLEGEKISTRDNIVGDKRNGIVIGHYTSVKKLSFAPEGKKAYHIGFVSGYDNELGPPRDQALLTKYIAEKSGYD